MTRLMDVGKRVLPHSVKEVGRSSIRTLATVSAGSRPLPDFVVLGTKRGGTTSMWNYLLQHPGVLPMVPSAENLKSPHYFYWHYDKGERWYRSHFATTWWRNRMARRAGGAVVTGEASPYYLYDPRVPARMHTLMPDARLVVMLRDPVERAYSHYKERQRAGVEPLSFDQALAAEDGRLSGEVERMSRQPDYYSRPHDWFSYRDRGIYQPQLEGWLGHYSRDQVLILLSEDFYRDPAAVYSVVTHFLGLPSMSCAAPRSGTTSRPRACHRVAQRQLTEFFAPHNERLSRYLGQDLGWATP